MPKNINRKGFALGALFALVASTFTAAPAALAADGDQLQFTPAAGTTYTSLVTEDFQMAVSFKPAYAASSYARLSYILEKTAGTLDIYATTSAQALAVGTLDATSASYTVLGAASTKKTFSPVATTDSGLNGLVLQAATGSGVVNVTSSSPKTTVKVTAFIDSSPTNGVLDSGEWYVTQDVVFIPFADLTSSITVTAPIEGDTFVTASAVVSGINLEQANGSFFFAFSSSADVGMSKSASIAATKVLSASAAITAAALNASVSAQLRYATSAVSAGAWNGTDGVAITAASKLGATARGFDSVDVSASPGVNATNSAKVRVNSSWTARVAVMTGSKSVSAVAVEFSITSSAELSLTKTLSVNGVAKSVSAAEFTVSATTDANGFATVDLATYGYAATDTVTVTATAKGLSDSIIFDLDAPVFKIENEYDYYSATPGASTALVFEVTDQWGVNSTLANQQIKVTRGGTGFAYATTVSYVALTAGKGTLNFVAEPATKTGSATVDTVLQSYDAATNLWTDGASGTQVVINVTSVANAFSVSPAATVSGSISYVVNNNISWSSGVTATVTNKGATVTLSSADVIFRENGETATTSGSIVLRANDSGVVTVDLASRKAGTHTISWTVGGVTTTSQLIVDPAADSAGKTITFDTATIASGATATIVGTLVDAEGNAVETSGSADIVVTYTGAGIPIGTLPSETDEDGQFSFTVLTGASDKGAATATAVYRKSGAATAAADKLSFTQPITVGAAAVVSVDQKLTIGTFNGYIAIYAKGYEGQKLSYKVAGKWGSVASLKAFERVVRKTGAGYEIKVDLYIDGVKVKSETVTTK